jgi:hypothetical protein
MKKVKDVQIVIVNKEGIAPASIKQDFDEKEFTVL